MRHCNVWSSLAVFGLVAVLAAPAAEAGTKLLRFPDIHDDQVVFSYGGDLWRASADGGTAARLTAHPGQELFAKFSPDGEWIAFTGQYDGDEQVYVVPAAGGEPRQLTYYPAHGPLPPRWGYDNQVYGWTPDGQKILFRSLRDANGGSTESALFTVSVEGGLPVRLPMPTAGAGDFSPDGSRLVYSPLFRDFRTWKRYEGGWAQDLYIVDPATLELEPVAHSPRSERDPMWIGDAVYFASDRDGTLNLYRFDLTGKATEQLTHSTEWDVRWPSSDGRGRIVFESNGELTVFDTATRTAQAIDITVPADALARRPARISAASAVEDFELAPRGERALFVARGDVFSAPIEKGPTRNLTGSSGAHDRHARWSPDGRTIAFVSDRSGEEHVWLVSQDGTDAPRQLTDGFAALLLAPAWSPDSRRIAFGDHHGRVRVAEVATGSITEVVDDPRGIIGDYAWSPDSRYLAFSMAEKSGFSAVWIWDGRDGQLHRVTDGFAESSGPSFSPDGKLLYILSDREYAPQISGIEWNYATNRNTGIYALALRADVEHPFPPESDEVKLEDDEKPAKAPAEDAKKTKKSKDTEDTDDEAAKPKVEPVTIDWQGLGERIARVPVDFDNYGSLHATDGRLIYTVRAAPFYGRESYATTKLASFDLAERKQTVLAESMQGFALSPDGSKVLVHDGGYTLMDVNGNGEKKSVSTAGLMVDRVPAEEWANVFDEVWRRYRDLFYVRNMHGYDWAAIGERYRALLPHVAHRSDLNYVLGEMIAELNVGHAYIDGGDFEIPARPKVALPGARFELDEAAGRYRIARILTGENAEEKYRAPLTEVGVDVAAGEYVLAIDGQELEGDDNPYRLLRHKKDPVALLVNDRPTREGAREVVFNPIFDESSLLYLEWVEGNHRKVTEMTDGRVGYLHIPDMGAPGIAEFIKWFYPQIRKEGLIVDVRSNGGGNVSQWIIERLDSKLLGTRFRFTSDEPGTYPGTVFHGHMAALLNETSASDGDIFPYMFREAGLGPLIGKRSWGGVVGISGWGPLIDGGSVFVPLSGTNDVDGQWVIEGHGVDPDIVVENDPASVVAGRDPQLERGVAEVMARIEADPKKLPTRPADPVKTPQR